MRSKLDAAIARSGSHVCVGLDPDPKLMPVSDVFEFNRAIVDATHDLVAAYKPQLAFYEAGGLAGMKALESTVRYIRDVAPGVFLVADAKRGDIASTGSAYAKAMFDAWDFDAATVSPYLGIDAIAPFLEREDRGAFVLCWTSNPGGWQVQDFRDSDGVAVYERVADIAVGAGNGENVGLVVAPSPDPESGEMSTRVLRSISARYPDVPLLIPGVGAQGGSASDCSAAAGEAFLINSSRGVIYASNDPLEFPDAARRAVSKLREEITEGLGRNA